MDQIVEKANKILKDPDIIIAFEDFSIVWVSEKFSKMLEYTQEELIEKQITEIVDMPIDIIRKMSFEDLAHLEGEQVIKVKTKSNKQSTISVLEKVMQIGDLYYIVGKNK
ncbi:PAS domain-containing protein [Candidatus Woesearchaeota archaeon]|nr:PAS domain-containing protein [Candidatus Woesearchaeota archaeon]